MKIVLVFLLLLAGCATPAKAPQLAANQIRVDHYSQPNGAIIYMNNTAIGTTPFSLVYTGNSLLTSEGTGNLSLTAVWPSGAKATQVVRVNIRQQQHISVVLSRPVDAPRLDIDMANAAQIQARVDAAKAQADARTDAMWQALGNSAANMGSRRINCTTIGPTTSCN